MKDAMEKDGIKNLILTSKHNITYTTGIREPSGIAVITLECGDFLVVPLLDYYRTLESAPRGFEVRVAYRSNEEPIKADVPSTIVIRDQPSKAALAIAGECGGSVAADLGWASYEVGWLLSDAGVSDASGLIWSVRTVKSDYEIEAIEAASRVAERALAEIVDSLDDGISELDLSVVHERVNAEEGAWDKAFPTIVAFYQNTAHPHHTPGMLRLQGPGPVLIDLGSIVTGYNSDMTRTLDWLGGAGRDFHRALDAVKEALEAAVDAVAPGAEAWSVDKEARRVLEGYGLDKYFIHGTGHGVGVEIHEPPYLRPGSNEVLEPGNVVTVEPGVYVYGRWGIRIEDMVLVTKRGRRVITRFQRILP